MTLFSAYSLPDQPRPLLTAQEAQRIGDEFLQLEKYVNLNYMGFHKILKKHDKNLPQSPCRQFYISHLHNQPWVQVRAGGRAGVRRFLWWHRDVGGHVWLIILNSAMQGNYSDLLVTLSNVYSELRGDVAAGGPEDAGDGEDYQVSTTKYWVSMGDVSAIKHHILQHLPVYQFNDVSVY